MKNRNENRALVEALSALFLLPATVAGLALGVIYDRAEPLTYTPPTVEQDVTPEAYTIALPVASPAGPEDLPINCAVSAVLAGAPVRRAAKEWGVPASTLRGRVKRARAG